MCNFEFGDNGNCEDCSDFTSSNDCARFSTTRGHDECIKICISGGENIGPLFEFLDWTDNSTFGLCSVFFKSR